METLITLANGDVTAPDKLRHYFDTVFAAEDGGEEFAVNLEHIWRVGYSRKDVAVRALVTQFSEGIDWPIVATLSKVSVVAILITFADHHCCCCISGLMRGSNQSLFSELVTVGPYKLPLRLSQLVCVVEDGLLGT